MEVVGEVAEDGYTFDQKIFDRKRPFEPYPDSTVAKKDSKTRIVKRKKFTRHVQYFGR